MLRLGCPMSSTVGHIGPGSRRALQVARYVFVFVIVPLSVSVTLVSGFGFVNFLLDLLQRLHCAHNFCVTVYGKLLLLKRLTFPTFSPSVPLSTSLTSTLAKIQSKNYKRKQVGNMANSCIVSTSIFKCFPFCSSRIFVLGMCCAFIVMPHFCFPFELKIAAGKVGFWPGLNCLASNLCLHSSQPHSSHTSQLLNTPNSRAKSWQGFGSDAVQEVFARILRPKSIQRPKLLGAHRCCCCYLLFFHLLVFVFCVLLHMVGILFFCCDL